MTSGSSDASPRADGPPEGPDGPGGADRPGGEGGAERRGGPQRIPRPPGVEPGEPAPWRSAPRELLRPTLGDIVTVMGSLGPAVESPVERGGFSVADLPADLRPVASDRQARPSAVLVPLYERDGEAWVVLTRRSRALRAHAGEVSFPGGRAEAGDPDLVATALRESREEIGLDPESASVVGELDHLATVTSGSFIVPWVGVVPERPELTPSSDEVEAVLEVPLSELMTPGVFREERWSLGGAKRPIVFFDLVGDTVWGATAAMLRQLLGMVTGTLGRGDLGHD